MASLSGPNSTRRLGTQSGAMRREARSLKRGGFNRASEALALGASQQRLTEGSAITSSEETIRERDLMRRRDQGLMRQQRDSLLKPEAGAAAPAAPLPTAIPAAIPTSSPPTLSSPPPAAPPREGLIDGKPASLTLRRPADSGPGNLRELQQRDAAGRTAVLNDAMAAGSDGTTSRTRQDVVDEANRSRAAAGKAPFDDSIYTEMSRMDSAKRAETLRGADLVRGLGSSTLPTINRGLGRTWREQRLAPDTGAKPVASAVPPPVTAPGSAPLPSRSLAYRLGAGIRSAPQDVSNAAGGAAAAVGKALGAAGEAVGDLGVRTDRKLRRNARDFKSGFSGR